MVGREELWVMYFPPINLWSLPKQRRDYSMAKENIWDILFRKPPPVFDRDKWEHSEESKKYIYIPNCSWQKGVDVEAYNSNAMYTQVMLYAYQSMCRDQGLNPYIKLSSGRERKVLDLLPFHAVQLHWEGERASGFVNSTLVDCTDSHLEVEFIKSIQGLTAGQCLSDPSKQTVLAKVEVMLRGKSAHKHNQEFAKTFFTLLGGMEDELFKENAERIHSTLLNILRSLALDGRVMETSKEEFTSRVWAAGLGDYSGQLEEVYSEACDA